MVSSIFGPININKSTRGNFTSTYLLINTRSIKYLSCSMFPFPLIMALQWVYMSLLTSPALELQILWHAWYCCSICLGGVGFCLSWADSWQYGCCLLLCCCLLISCVWYDLYLGWWRGAWYIDECLLLMWLLCPALDLYVISEIVDLLRLLGGGVVSWCFWVMCVQAFPLSKSYIGALPYIFVLFFVTFFHVIFFS